MALKNAKYVTLYANKDGHISFVSGKKMNYYGPDKALVPPVLEGESNYYDSTYSTMGKWAHSEEFKEWLYEEAKKWAEEIDGMVIHEDDRREYDYTSNSRPIPKPE